MLHSLLCIHTTYARHNSINLIRIINVGGLLSVDVPYFFRCECFDPGRLRLRHSTWYHGSWKIPGQAIFPSFLFASSFVLLACGLFCVESSHSYLVLFVSNIVTSEKLNSSGKESETINSTVFLYIIVSVQHKNKYACKPSNGIFTENLSTIRSMFILELRTERDSSHNVNWCYRSTKPQRGRAESVCACVGLLIHPCEFITLPPLEQSLIVLHLSFFQAQQ